MSYHRHRHHRRLHLPHCWVLQNVVNVGDEQRCRARYLDSLRQRWACLRACISFILKRLNTRFQTNSTFAHLWLSSTLPDPSPPPSPFPFLRAHSWRAIMKRIRSDCLRSDHQSISTINIENLIDSYLYLVLTSAALLEDFLKSTIIL